MQKAEQMYGRPARVLSSTIYKIGKAHVLVRVASELKPGRRHFLGLKYAALEELVNLEHPIVALVCGTLESEIRIFCVWATRWIYSIMLREVELCLC